MSRNLAADRLRELKKFRKERSRLAWERSPDGFSELLASLSSKQSRRRKVKSNPLPPWPAWVRERLGTDSPSPQELDWLEQKLREQATEEAVLSRPAVTVDTNAVADKAESSSQRPQHAKLRSPFKMAIREALLNLGNDASAQQVATWISENCQNSEFPHLTAKYGPRIDLGQLYRTNKTFRGLFDRKVSDIRKLLKE